MLYFQMLMDEITLFCARCNTCLSYSLQTDAISLCFIHPKSAIRDTCEQSVIEGFPCDLTSWQNA